MSVVQHNNSANAIQLIASDGLSEATILPTYGGTVASLRLPGMHGVRECLYQHPHFWQLPRDDLAGGMPFVFPAFGRLESDNEMGVYWYDGQRYRLPIHGFAWHSAWRVLTQTPHALSLQLTDTPETRAQYPFAFEVQLHYQLMPGRLICEQRYRNGDTKPMPFSAGFHPYLVTPPADQGKEQVQIHYHAEKQFRYNTRFTAIASEVSPARLPSSVCAPPLQDALSQLGPNKQVELRYPSGEVLQLCAEGVEDPGLFRYLQLYTVADQPFFCAEPLTSPPNSLNHGVSLRWLAPGQEVRGVFTVSMRYNPQLSSYR